MPGIISGGAWLSDRRHFLQEELAKDPPPAPDQRAVLEAELAAVNQQLADRKRHWWRSLRWGSRPPNCPTQRSAGRTLPTLGRLLGLLDGPLLHQALAGLLG